ncbi:2-dehydro-3-deoxygalactonokinase [Caenimonas koreensis]|uniref:2-dehydro-3-deoxygalactonokinase n=1 Tax=Caenimonas koreensis TaxID=367474 RepID=UPI0037839CD6
MSRMLIGVDWGTSSLRVARIDRPGDASEERAVPNGILSVPPGGFPAALADVCGDWLRNRDALVLVCGMAGSQQGWAEAPYCACPAGFADVASHLKWVEPGRIAIVPGMSCEHDGMPDVMRGEETQVFGALSLLAMSDATLVLPGTHSKWVQVSDGRIERFSTFMTGEVFALLRRHSILARTMAVETAEDALDEHAFSDGVQAAVAATLAQRGARGHHRE